jgi:hypothetical protein
MSEVLTEPTEIRAELMPTNPAPPLKLLAAMHAARGDMQSVGMSGHNEFDHYDYATMGDFLEAVRGPLQGHGLLLMAEEYGPPEYFKTPNPKMACGCRVMMQTTLTHIESGEVLRHLSAGEAWDRGDKALYKAKTGARKYGLQCLFNLYGDDDPERDSAPGATLSQPIQTRSPNRGAAGGHDQPPASPSVPARPPGPPTFEQCVQYVDATKTPAELTELIERMAHGTHVRNDKPLFLRVLRRALDRTEAKYQAGEWAGDEADRAQDTLDRVRDSIDPPPANGPSETEAPTNPPETQGELI